MTTADVHHRGYVVTLPHIHRVMCACGWSREFKDYAEAWQWADYHPRSMDVMHPIPAGATRGFCD